MDFGVYLQITNSLPVALNFSRFESSESQCCTYAGPASIPNDGQPHTVHFNDPCTGVGAEGTAYFVAEIDGVAREYAWHGNCPVWSSAKQASGPGITSFNKTGHPLQVQISVNASTAGWTAADQPIKHVFVLMLENRSFDHMLGFSGISGTDAATGTPTKINGLTGNESNTDGAGNPYRVTRGADWAMPIDPGHEFWDVGEQLTGLFPFDYSPARGYGPTDNSGFVRNYVRQGQQAAANPGEIMKCYGPDQLPVLNALASEFVICDAWFAAVPGPTWPNRFFMMAASAGGLDRTPSNGQVILWEAGLGFSFQHGNLFEAVVAHDQQWRIYRGDVGPILGGIPISGGLKGVLRGMRVGSPIGPPIPGLTWTYINVNPFSQFARDVKGHYPYAFTLIEPNYGSALDSSFKGGTSQHPIDDVRYGELLIKRTYEALRNSPLWPSSMLIVTWDEHGGFYDHVSPAPGGAVKPGDKITTPGQVNLTGFTFDTYGVRVPAVVASPYIPRNLIDHRTYDHSSIPKTVGQLFGIPPLTDRDAAAAGLTRLVSLKTPRDTPTTLPNPAGRPIPVEEAAEEQPAAFDSDEPIGHSNLAGFLAVALRYNIESSPPEERELILSRVAAISTRGEALRYIEEIMAKVNDAEATPASEGRPAPLTGGS